jgi:hypothetical protein
MPQLVMQKPATAATFQIAFASFGIPLIDVSFVVEQLPRSAMFGCRRHAVFVLRHPPLEIRGEADIKTEVL